MRAVVTGAGSFLGSHTVKALKEKGLEVTELRHSFEEEPEKLPAAIDIWIHFAWAGRGPEGRADKDIQAYNIGMSMAALRMAHELHAKCFVFAGSQAEYGPQKDLPIRESAGCAPVSEYGKAKLAFYEFARRWIMSIPYETDDKDLMRYLHLRIFSVFGEGDREDSLISSAIRELSAGRPMELSSCRQLWNYMYVKDAARAIVEAALDSAKSMDPECGSPEGKDKVQGSLCSIMNIAGEDVRPLRSYVEELRDLLSSRSELRFGARGQNLEGAADLAPDITGLLSLGFHEEYSFSSAIRDMLHMEQETGPDIA